MYKYFFNYLLAYGANRGILESTSFWTHTHKLWTTQIDKKITKFLISKEKKLEFEDILRRTENTQFTMSASSASKNKEKNTTFKIMITESKVRK